MFVNKKVLAAAVVGVLFAGNAAAVDFTAGSAAAVAASAGKYAKEIKIDSTNGTSFAPSAANQIKWALGINLSPGEQKFVRIEAAGHVEFQAFTPTIAADASGATVLPGSINGVGSNVIIMSLTADPANNPGDETAGVVITLPADLVLYDSASSDVKVSLYDTSSQAQQGGTTGLNTFGSYSGAYFSFANSLRWVGTPATLTADVAATPSYTRFLAGALGGTLNTGLGIATVAGGTVTANGTTVTPATLLAATSSMTISGDFSFLRSSNAASGYDAAARGRVVFNTGTATNPAAMTADSVRIPFTNGFAADLIVGPKLVGAFNPVIAASGYTAKLNAVAAAPTAYNLPVLADANVGTIDHNGTTLQAPLAQIPAGWISRIVLTNTSGAERPFTISLLKAVNEADAGAAPTAGTTSGTIPANGTRVIDNLNTVFSGTNRATVVVDIAAPNAAVQGLYQIVNPESGSISNYVMIRPGTN